ncbi:MAG TPA: hypothetical protein VEW93_07625 [Acidimicrobiales bacterium]|nr:hypothetical protein [Acidimicrobiales bacterium]
MGVGIGGPLLTHRVRNETFMSKDLSRYLRRRRRPLTGAVLALALVVTAAACEPGPPPPPENAPYWHPGTTVDATTRGPLVRIEWDATTGGDPAASYQINLTTYQGTVVALVPASVRACDITGLAASTAYTIVVTARDAQQHWSGPHTGTKGNRTTTITTTSHGGSGTLWCHPITDTDGDGLPNALETNDGTYTSASDTGTDPANPDTDNDGINDGDETLGRPGLNLVAMGARPTRKDLLIETDWISGATCSLQPNTARFDPMVTAFAVSPVTGLGGFPGINVIVDWGQGGLFTGGNQVPDPDGTLDGRFTGQNVNGSHFAATKAAHFDPVRKGIFHYSVTHSGNGYASTAESRGDDSYVNGGCGQGSSLHYPAHLMHEIGHNLGLGHAGTYEGLPGPGRPCDDPPVDSNCVFKTAINHKPNYVSVMNYLYLGGLDDSCRRYVPSGEPEWLDYSSGTRAIIDEAALDETVGICDGVPYDFNANGVIDPAPYRADITSDGVVTPLADHDDWDHIDRLGLADFANDPD